MIYQCLCRTIAIGLWLLVCSMATAQTDTTITLSHGPDLSAGGDESYIITTASATYYLEKSGGGLSSLVDRDGVDWLGFNKRPGSGWKGEYRGFPNAIHKQDGSYFHAMNATTTRSTSHVTIHTPEHLQIVFTSQNKQWQGQWDFYADRCDFTMTQVSQGYHYWVLYEGVPNGEIDAQDYWFSSRDTERHPIEEAFRADLPSPEWIAFGDGSIHRVLYLLQHHDDDHMDEYSSRPYMTVFGFGRNEKAKAIATPNTFSIGFIETDDYKTVAQHIQALVETVTPLKP